MTNGLVKKAAVFFICFNNILLILTGYEMIILFCNPIINRKTDY